MKCPACTAELVRVTYEGLPVFRCQQCCGYLVGRRRLEGIKRSRGKSVEELKQETLAESRADTEQRVRCPRCRVYMKKEFLKDPASFHIDTCASCELIWFDGGELARLQLAHEITPQAREAAEFQRRLREMSPEQRAQFEENLANLPEPESPLFGGFREAVIGSLFGRGRWPG